MAIIPADEKVFMVDKRTNTVYGGSQALQDMQQWYTMQDVADSVAAATPYKIFTALLTQSGGDNPISLNYDDVPGGPSLNIGTTYVIGDNTDGLDMTNVGAPNNNVDTYFIATGTTPASWGSGFLRYNTGAPVATVLENTIGNVWFTYNNEGEYYINSIELFDLNKIYNSVTNNIDVFNFGGFQSITIYPISIEQLFLATGNTDGHYNDILNNTPIEIRVYN